MREPLRVLAGYRHDLQITYRPRSSWWLVGLAAIVIFAVKLGG